MKFFKNLVVFLVLYLCTSTSAYAAQHKPDCWKKYEWKEVFVESGTAKLFCTVAGEGSPLIILHGGPGLSQDYLLTSLTRLAQTNRVIFFDQRGCGKSEGVVDAESIKIEHFIEDIEAVRKAFGCKKVSLIGHSWGGHLAMLYAVSHPDCIDKLVLMNSTAATSSDFALFIKEWSRRLASQMNELQALKESDAYKRGDPETVSQYFKIMFRSYCFHEEDADKLNLIMPAMASINGNKTYEFLKQSYLVKPFDLTDDLKKLSCKTLIIHGDYDPIPLQTAKHVQESIAGSKLVVIEQCGHFPYVEQPAQFFKHLLAFLRNQ